MWVLTVGMSVGESRGSKDSAEVFVSVLVAGSQELEYKDWLCCWWGCVGTGYDSVIASVEVVGSLKREEECDGP